MKYPEFIKKGDYIAVTAPSCGIVETDKMKEYENAIVNIKNLGFNFIETENVRKYEYGRSSSGKQRAKEFMDVWKNEDVKAIICAAGGDFACEILDYLDFEELKKIKSKWLQGFSDITNLGFVFTTNLDIATIYGENIRDYGMKKIFPNLTNSIKIMQGKKIAQNSFEKYEPIDEKRGIFESYHLVKENKWKLINKETDLELSGRCIGGCFDVIINLIGTRYDKIKEYIEKYKNDGIIWFFDVFEMSTPQVFCHLWQMKNSGYFENCKGIIFGRPYSIREDYDMSFKDVIRDSLEDLKIPIILDADIGHVPPQLPIVNGAIMNLKLRNGEAEMKFDFK